MKTNKKNRMDCFQWIMFAVITIWIASLLFLLGFGFFNSFKYWNDFDRGNVFGWPSEKYGFVLDNYMTMWVNFHKKIATSSGQRPVYVEEMLFNSLVYATVMSLVNMSTQLMVAYAVAKFNFKFRNVLYFTAIVVMLIPIVGALPSEMQMAESLGLIDNVLGISIMRSKYPGMHFLIFYSMFKGISWTYAEAAQMDGAGHWRILLSIMMPLVTNVLIGVFILQFITNWNEYYTPMLFTPSFPTVALGLYSYDHSSEGYVTTTEKLAACFVTCIPVLALFIIFRNKIMGNLSMGGIKG